MTPEGQAAASGDPEAATARLLRARAEQSALKFGNYGYYTPNDAQLDRKAADTIDALERRVRDLTEGRDMIGNLWAQEKERAEPREAALAEALRQLREMAEALEWIEACTNEYSIACRARSTLAKAQSQR